MYRPTARPGRQRGLALGLLAMIALSVLAFAGPAGETARRNLIREENRKPDGQGFAAFGRVVRGLEVVRAIQAAAAEGQRLTPPVKILRVRRVPGG